MQVWVRNQCLWKQNTAVVMLIQLRVDVNLMKLPTLIILLCLIFADLKKSCAQECLSQSYELPLIDSFTAIESCQNHAL
jgi:hypothetical protein